MKHLENLVAASIQKINESKIDVYSYAIYFDHESKRRISVCIDTRENSLRAVKKSNQFREKYVTKFRNDGNCDSLGNFSANSGRNYSLGDFKYRNRVSFENKKDTDLPDTYTLKAIKAVVARQDEITRFSTKPEQVLFSCSTQNDEYGASWFKLNPALR